MADTSKCFSLLRGRVMRVTKLDACGARVLGPDSTVVSEGFISIALSPQTEEGQTISVTNAAGKVCLFDEACPIFTGYDTTIEFCGVNPNTINLMTGQPIVTDSQETPQGVGFRVNSGTDLCASGFALEVWSNVPAAACVGGQASYGYFLVPFLKGGVIGDFSIANDAINFTLTNARSRDGSAWGVGPYDVTLGGVQNNEEQTVTITGSPTGGNFTLTFNGDTTANIAHNATATAVRSALEALDNIEPGDVTVTGGPGPGTPYVVTFAGQYVSTNVPEMSAAHTFTGGTAPDVAVTTTSAGVSGVPSPLKDPIDPKDHLHVELVQVAPPTEACGALPLGVPAEGATAGAPGEYTPANSYGPADFADLTANPIVATPATAWTTGQHIVLRDGSTAHWDSSAWVAGVA